MKKSFVLYHDFEATLNELSDEQAGKLLRATFAYSARGEIVDYGELAVKLTMPAVRAQIDRDNEKYDKVCERNRKNGQLGGRKTETQSNPVGSSGVQSNPVGADSDSLSDSQSLSDNQEKENINTAPPIGESESEPKRESKRFVPPSLADVTEYLTAKNSPIDPETFHAFYEANGWVQGSGGKKIKSWKACATTWEKRHAKDNPTRPQDTRWQKFRTWVARYDEKRRIWHPDALQLSPGEIDEAAKVVAEYIAPDAFTEELLGLGIEWLLQAPERCAYVPTLKNLGDFASPAWGSIAGWACNAVRGVEVTASPFETGI